MAKTLNKEDLAAIKGVVNEVVKPVIAEAVDELAAATDGAIRKEAAMIREEMATKEDLKDFATKHDLRDAVIDLKDEIHSVLENHEQRITKLEERVQ